MSDLEIFGLILLIVCAICAGSSDGDETFEDYD